MKYKQLYTLCLRVPVFWQSKSQQSMTLLRSEAKWVALLEAVKEVMFMIQILESMRVSVKPPFMVRDDNVGAISMTGNVIATSCPKHKDITSMCLSMKRIA